MYKYIKYLIEDFILYCMQKNQTVKTYRLYQQTLKLFQLFLKEEYNITEIDKVERKENIQKNI